MNASISRRSRSVPPVCAWTVIGLMVSLGVRGASGQAAAAGAKQVAGSRLPEAPEAAGVKTPGAPAWEPPVQDNRIYTLVVFDELEGRTGGSGSAFRWNGEGWIGTDANRLWLKSEGFLEGTTMSEGDQEALYDRPIPHTRYFDAQIGVREDLDSGPRRTWGAVGIEGLAPQFFKVQPTFYFRDGGNVASRLEGSYDLPITQRLVVQPQGELNFYSKNDPGRGTGSGLSDIDTGIRIRYEISRKFAPYVGFAYAGKYGDTATYARQAGEAVDGPTFVFGIRVWH